MFFCKRIFITSLLLIGLTLDMNAMNNRQFREHRSVEELTDKELSGFDEKRIERVGALGRGKTLGVKNLVKRPNRPKSFLKQGVIFIVVFIAFQMLFRLLLPTDGGAVTCSEVNRFYKW